jgi:MinD-like ATPase involved in chromosome partitioning or flagellar assembly
VLGRPPDVLVPSDRDIPRALSEGLPIVLSKPGSAAATAFHYLATLYHSNGEGPAADGRPRRRRLLGGKV